MPATHAALTEALSRTTGNPYPFTLSQPLYRLRSAHSAS
jgi:hypothetical protein